MRSPVKGDVVRRARLHILHDGLQDLGAMPGTAEQLPVGEASQPLAGELGEPRTGQGRQVRIGQMGEQQHGRPDQRLISPSLTRRFGSGSDDRGATAHE